MLDQFCQGPGIVGTYCGKQAAGAYAHLLGSRIDAEPTGVSLRVRKVGQVLSAILFNSSLDCRHPRNV